MPVTYFVALPFINSEDGPVPGEGVQCPSASGARFKARDLVKGEVVGAVAFSRSGEPELGEFEAAEVLLKVGIVPEDFAALTISETG